MKNLNPIVVILALLVGVGLGFILGRHRYDVEPITITRVDTLKVREPAPVAEYHFGSIPYPVALKQIDTLMQREIIHDTDSIYIEIPKEVKEYRDSSYYAVVSGYMPKLEYIETYSKTTTNKTKTPKFSWGLQGGFGVVIPINQSITAGGYIGLGIQYKF